jgi:hypothetical protein
MRHTLDRVVGILGGGGWTRWGDVRGYLCCERLEGFAPGADEDVCEGGLLDRGEGDEDDFCTLKLELNASVSVQL